jgi:hypothetical protein
MIARCPDEKQFSAEPAIERQRQVPARPYGSRQVVREGVRDQNTGRKLAARDSAGRKVESTFMTCRIDRAVGADDLIVLSISGEIKGQDVDMLRNVLRQETGALAIDLKNVSLVDRQGVKLLALSEYNGAQLMNCPAYVREWVVSETAEWNADSPGQGTEGTEGG